MKVLAFDTSSYHGSFALVQDNKCQVELNGEFGSRHSERIITEIDHLLGLVEWKKADIDAIVVGLGPGSFTGLRVGMATAHGLSFALKKPLFGISSLDAMAQTAPAGPSLLATCVDARKQELYVRFYRRFRSASSGEMNENESDSWVRELPSVEPVTPHLLLSASGLAHAINNHGEEIALIGSGAQLYLDVLRAEVTYPIYTNPHADGHRLSASKLASLAMPQINSGVSVPPHSIQPIYIRPSDAEINIGPPTGGPPLKGRMSPDGTIHPPTETKES